MAKGTRKPKLAVWKFTSCDGCQLTLLDLEEHLLAIADRVDEEELIRKVRKQSRFLVAIGACATAGGIQALRNFAHVRDFIQLVYAHPEYIRTLAHVRPIADVVPVDFELRGCPITRGDALAALAPWIRPIPCPWVVAWKTWA